jgi:ATP-binding cassette subfamily F protein uup
MDKVVDHLFVFEGQGPVKDFPGNYSDYRDWQAEKEKADHSSDRKEKIVKPKPDKKSVRKLSFGEKRELELLEKDIAILEEEKGMIEAAMNSGNCSSADLIDKSQRHGKIMELLAVKELRWLELSEIES